MKLADLGKLVFLASACVSLLACVSEPRSGDEPEGAAQVEDHSPAAAQPQEELASAPAVAAGDTSSSSLDEAASPDSAPAQQPLESGDDEQSAPEAQDSTDGLSLQVQARTPGVHHTAAERVMYFVLIDRFFDGDPTNNVTGTDPEGVGSWHGGDFRGLRERLTYLAELGVNTLWINPIVAQIEHPVGGNGFEHWGFHGYWAADFESIDPHLGTATELAIMLQAAHGLGISVLLDVVLNHPGYGSRFTSDVSWVRSTETGTCDPSDTDNLTLCLFGLPDFRTEDPAIADQIIEWQARWFESFPFDGLRADTVKHIEPEVWQRFLDRVRGSALVGSENFFALSEYWGSAPGDDDELLSEGMFDAQFDFGFYQLVESYLNGRLRAAAFAHHLQRRNDAAVGRCGHFLNTHDTTTLYSQLEDPTSYRTALVLLLTSAGVPLLYYGDELGREGGEWPHNRPFMPWERLDNLEATPHQLVRELIELRLSQPALTRGNMEILETREGLVVMAREYQDQRLVVVANRAEGVESLDCSLFTLPCRLLFCDRCSLDESGAAVRLESWGSAVLRAQ